MNEVVLNYIVDKFRRFHLSPSNTLSHVGTYTRELPINLERMYENALDGEHLPYLHSSTFSHLEILDSGPWGWHAKGGLHPRSKLTDMEIKLVLNKDEFCWKTTTLSGLGKGTEIWTHAIPLGENRIKVVVDFYIPKVPGFLKPMYKDFYFKTYAKLYDEDLMMMSQRQEALDFRKNADKKPSKERVLLGKKSDILDQQAFTFTIGQHRFCLKQIDGDLIAYSATCPHMLSPLEHEKVENGIVECPWHAYQFDIKTGNCVSGQNCRLKAAPQIIIDNNTDEIFAQP